MPLIQLEPAASSVAPIFVQNSHDAAATTTTGTDSSPVLLETTTKNDVIILSLEPDEDTTELSSTSDILHDEFSLHEHDETTNAGGVHDYIFWEKTVI